MSSAMAQNFDDAVRFVQGARDAHQTWIDWQREHGDHDRAACMECQKWGDVEFHTTCVAEYEHVLAILAWLAKTRDEAFVWLVRAYHSGHREGWEPGLSTSETMDGLHAFLCNAELDPNTKATKAWLAARTEGSA